MDLRTILKNLWLAITVFMFFCGGYFIATQHYKEVIAAKERRFSQECARVKAEADLKIEHFQREAAEQANEAILEQQRKSRERENEIYKEMAALQRRFSDNRTLIKQLHESQASLCSRGVLPADTCQRHLRACEKLLGSSAETIGRSIELLQEQSVITGAGK
ncbi:hypothetical protein [uncultured Parasutterella sp.]|jgi:hypothetical protein|uniref:hypothetical protein n=1 Tax=uncultured Parasutterella sp. TaxID=1263098 RepID=UPI0025CC6BD5|nr:hypothetical protein [uncultured Parasutterella sp.]